MNLGMAYFLTGGDTKYSDRAWVELQNAANYKDWNAERHFLDPSEMGAAFAIGYDWMYNEWTKDQRKLMEDKMMEYQLNYVKKAYYNSFSASWAKGDNNWNAVCNGGALRAAVALYDKYPDMCSDIVEKALRGVEYMIRYFYPKGAWYEGTGYWGYAMTVSYTHLE